MEKIALIFLSLTVTLTAGWWRTFGGVSEDVGYCVRQTESGDYIISGTICDEFGLLRTDAEGNCIWDVRFGGSAAYCVVEATDGGFVATGDGFEKEAILKTDTLGNKMWSTDVLGGYKWIERTNNGEYIITGTRVRSYGSDPEAWGATMQLIHFKKTGEVDWGRAYGEMTADFFSEGSCVRELPSGEFVISGYIDGSPGWIKTETNGNIINVYLKDYPSNIINIQQTSSGGYFLLASGEIIRVDSGGVILWIQSHGGAYTNFCLINQDKYMLTGEKEQNLWLVAVDSSGEILWERTYGGPESDIGYFVQKTQDNGYIITGTTYSFGAGSSDILLIKTDSLGNIGDIPLNVSPVLVWAPERNQNTYSFTPSALFENISTEDYVGDFYCYCEIIDTNTDELLYKDSVFVQGGISVLESKTIDFKGWVSEDTTEYNALFYTKGEFETDSMEVGFRWSGIEVDPDPLDKVSLIGQHISLSYSGCIDGFHIYIYNSSGQKVDEIHSEAESGTITWPEELEKVSQGVYFFKEVLGKTIATQKVVLIR